ncbi:MAG: hypothetical protein IM613_12570 [Cytophagales bacterium]|jgi:hypothetical protein|nr:hypothetical protein [Cytophagales bacterium]
MAVYSVRVPVVVEVIVDVSSSICSDTDEIIDAAISKVFDMSWQELGEYSKDWDVVYDCSESGLQAEVVC